MLKYEEEVTRLLQLLADKNNWGYIDPSGCPKGIGIYNDSWIREGEHPVDMAQKLLNK